MKAPLSNSLREDYRYFLIVVFVAYFIVNFTYIYKDDDFLNRNSLKELISVIKISAILVLLVIFYFNFTKMNAVYSRIYEGIFIICLILIDFFLRVLVKRYLISSSINAEKTLLIAPYDEIKTLIDKIENSIDWRYTITGIVIIDKKVEEKTIEGIQIIPRNKSMFSNEVLAVYDNVIIAPGKQKKEVTQEWINRFKELGKTVSISLPEYEISMPLLH